MLNDASGRRLLGRRSECGMLDRLGADVRAGHSRVLVLHGEAGVGKTVLLEHLVQGAAGCRVARAAGVESEMELPFAGLQQLCASMVGGMERLPAPQRNALGKAFGLIVGPAPDQFLIGLAVLTLFSDAAENQPLLCVVDDAQWLDRASAQALAFVSRRLLAESVGIVFAVRADVARQPDTWGLPVLRLAGLTASDARLLLTAELRAPLDAAVRDRIIAETRGNPLALVELARNHTAAELAGGYGLPDTSSLTGRIEQGFVRQLEALPAPTQRLLLTAAAEPVGDLTLLWRAAKVLGIPISAGDAAEAAGLVEFRVKVRFRHPLVRSAAYRASTPADRRTVHTALADATDPDGDPDRRAWHRAHAAEGPDETVAIELERCAGRARTRGGLAATAAFLQQAAALTSDSGRRAGRELAAAQAQYQAGDTDSAQTLLAMAQAGPLNQMQGALADLLLAQISFAERRGSDAPPLLLKAAKQLEPLDTGLARETYLDAFAAALFAGRLARGGGMMREVAEAVLAADWGDSAGKRIRGCDLLLDGLALIISKGYAIGTPLLLRALQAIRDEPMTQEEQLRWLWLACRVARALGDDVSWDVLTDRQVRIAREAGALAVLPIALTERFSAELFAGRLDTATSLVAELAAVTEATGSQLSPHIAFLLATWGGREAEAMSLIEVSRQDVAQRGEGLWLIATEWSSAVFFNGLGRYDEALVAAERAAEHPYELGLSTWVCPELIEAATRSGHAERGAGAMERLSEIARAAGTDWALGIEARARAMLSDGPVADALYREAIERLGRTRIRVTLARAHLLYGEWLRREGRRVDAREQLRTAHDMLTDIGMAGFVDRAGRELLATGETVRKRSVDAPDDLTSQEAQIARLAGEGRTNPEIGAELFISPRTVEWHLRKVYGKLGVGSRRELRGQLART